MVTWRGEQVQDDGRHFEVKAQAAAVGHISCRITTMFVLWY